MFKNKKILIGISVSSLLLVFVISTFISFYIFNRSLEKQRTSDVKIKGMRIENIYTEDRVSILRTTGGLFRIDLENGIIEIKQRIGENRLLAAVFLTDGRFKFLSSPVQKDFDVIWEGTYPQDPKIIISGDSVIRFFNIKRLEVLLYFSPVHQAFNVSNDHGGLLALDDRGGLAIIPPSYASNKHWPKSFENNIWRLAAEEPLPLLFLGVLPPRPFDWERSFMPVIHYSSHLQRYPTDAEIAAYSKYAKVLELHSWIWKNRYNENERDEKGNKLPLWADYSYLPENGKWIPEDEKEFKRIINSAHLYGMKVLPYVSTSNYETDLDTFITEIKRLKDVYRIDGVYFDGLFPQQPELGYEAARILRKLFGEEGWLTLHDTHGSGYWAPFINTYMDLIITSEHDRFDRWTSTSYKISNAIASFWPEIPIELKDGRKFLQELVDNSLVYNNRVILMTGEKGQWRDWRLYFTSQEMSFMKEYYLGALKRMQEIGKFDK